MSHNRKNMGSRPKPGARTSQSTSQSTNQSLSQHLPQNPEQLHLVLSHLLADSTDTVKQAEAIIKEFLKHPASLQPMMHQITAISQSTDQSINQSNNAVRQIAAVLLRGHLKKLWKTADPSTKTSIKESLLNQLINEPNRQVMRAIAQLISKLAVEVKKWPALLAFLVKCSESPNADHREIALLLFSALTESIPKELQSHVNDLQVIFLKALNDSDDRVRIASLRAIEQLVDLVGPDNERGMMSLEPVIEPLIQLVSSFLSGQAHGRDEDVVKSVLHVFDCLSESPVPVLDAHFNHILPMMISIIQHRAFDVTIHEQATNFLVALINAKPNKVVKLGYVERLFALCIEMMTADPSDSFDADEACLLSMGIELCEALVNQISRQHITKHALTITSQLITSGSPIHMQAGFICLHHMAIPFCDDLDPLLKDIVPMLLGAVRHAHKGVRRTAWIAVGELAESILSFGLYASQVLPVAFEVLSSTNENSVVREKACFALESVCEHVEKEVIAPHADELMNRLFQLIQSPDLNVAGTSINTVRLLAGMELDNFARFTNVFVPVLGAMLQFEDDEHLVIRGQATECLGVFAVAAGSESLAPYLEDITAQVLRGFTLEHFGLRESGYLYFSRLILCLKDGIQPLLSSIFTLVLASVESGDGVDLVSRGNGLDDDEQDAYNSEFEDDDGVDVDDEELMMRRMAFSIRTGATDEKHAALTCLGVAFNTLDQPTNQSINHNSLLKPYLERTLLALEPIQDYPHDLIRSDVFRVYSEILTWRSRQSPQLPPPINGKFQASPPEDHELIGRLMSYIIYTLDSDDVSDVVDSACELLIQLFQMYGIACVYPEYNKVLHSACLSFLRLKAPCQRPSDDNDTDHHDPLTETITDVIPAWAKAGGPEFYGPFFSEHLSALLKLTAPSKPFEARSVAIGCLGDMTRALDSAMIPQSSRVIPVVLTGLQDQNVAIRRNSSYAIGEMISVMPQVLESHFQQIVDILEKMYHVPEDVSIFNTDLIQFTQDDYLGCRDNAASAISKIITANLNLGKVLDPRMSSWINLLLQGLPLLNDQQEAKYVYPLLLSLYQHHPNLIVQHTPTVLFIFAQMFGHPEVDLDLQRSIIAFCQACAKGENEKSVQQCVEQWSQQYQTQWRKFILENQPIVLPNKH